MMTNNNSYSTLLTGAVTSLLILIIWASFAPGFMSYDSVAQYQSALNQSYSDGHPAIMSYVWHLSLMLVSGPQSLLVFHLALLLIGIIIWQMNISNSYFRALISGLFFLPWILNFTGVLWKDVGMAFSLLVATGLLFNSKKSGRIALLGLPFLFYAFAVRHNAILATVPLIFLASLHYLRSKKISLGILITAVTSIAFWLAASTITYGFLKAERKHYETLLMGDEIAKISAQTGEHLLPWIKPDDLAACTRQPILYERALCFISRGYDPSGSLMTTMPYQVTHQLWKDTVLAHPLLSVKIHWDAFLYFLRSPSLAPAYVWQPGIMQNDLNITVSHPQGARWMERYVTKSQSGVLGELFKPYTWLILSIVMLALGTRIQSPVERMQIFALNLSALGCYFSLLAAVPSVDFRYAYWCVIATNLSIVIFLAASRRDNARLNPSLETAST